MDKNLNSASQFDLIQSILSLSRRVEEIAKELLKAKQGDKLITVSGINSKSTGTTGLITVPDGKTLVITHVVVRTNGFTNGSKSTQAVANFGNNSSSFDNFISAKTFTFSADKQYRMIKKDDTLLTALDGGTSFSIKITTGSNATTENWDVDVFGYFI